MLTKFQHHLFSHLCAFSDDQRGVTAIEYAIISAVVLAVLVSDNELKASLSDAMSVIIRNIASAQSSG